MVNLYPNPSSSTVSIDIDKSVSGQIEIVVMDVRGQVILRNQVTNANTTLINIPNQGLYLVSVLVNGKSISQERVVISK